MQIHPTQSTNFLTHLFGLSREPLLVVLSDSAPVLMQVLVGPRFTLEQCVDRSEMPGVLYHRQDKRLHPQMEKYFQILEETTPKVCSIPGTVVQNEGDVQQGLSQLQEAGRLLGKADDEAARDPAVKMLISKLRASLSYTITDVRIRLEAWKIARGGGWRDSARGMGPLIDQLRDIFRAHQGEGIFLIPTPYTNYGSR